MNADPTEVTLILKAHVAGDRQAQERLLRLIYDDLRQLAVRHMKGERPDHTLQPTILVHDAYMRLVHHDQMDWQGRAHFLALASTTLRRILVDHARARAARKRGGDAQRVSWTDHRAPEETELVDLLDLHEAIEKMRERHPRQAQLVDLRFFAGLNVAETAHALGVSRDTAKSDWKFARAWLNRELTRDHRGGGPPGSR